MNLWNAMKKLASYPEDSRDRQRIAIALAKGAVSRPARCIDLSEPGTWEFSGFSQNGEDGVIDVLRSQLLVRNRRCLEIGSGDGIENNTAWLIIAEKYAGLMIEAQGWLVNRTRRNVVGLSIGSECRSVFVTKEVLPGLIDSLPSLDPDVFSLDIDGNDYHVMQGLLRLGLRPRIVVVEFNSVFGPESAVTVPYRPEFALSKSHPSRLHYGVSIGGWRRLFESAGYRFVTVEQNGVNAFFVDPGCFTEEFLGQVQALGFAENRYQLHKFGIPSHQQFELIAGEPLIEVEP